MKKKKLTAKISFYVDKELRRQIEKNAEKMGLQISDYVRMMLKKCMEEKDNGTF